MYFGNGISFDYSHFLSGDINKLYGIKQNIDDFNTLDTIFRILDPYIVTVDVWAKESRYNYDFVATINSIEIVANIAKQLNDYTKELCDEAEK